MPHIGKSCLLSLNGSNRSGGPRSPTADGERMPHVRQPGEAGSAWSCFPYSSRRHAQSPSAAARARPVTAMVVHLLHERGALDINDRVADYIPEYATHGKGETTIGHVLAHRAGVPSLPKALLDVERASDREFVWRTLSEAKPIVKPGTL